MTQCAAKSKRTGERCGANAMHGTHLCYHHGGKTPKGIAAPQTTHGRYSKYLPGRLLERYNASLKDEQLLVLREDIAMLDGRLADVLGRVDTGEANIAWKLVRKTYEDVTDAVKSQDSAKMLGALREMERLIGRGMADYAAWNEVYTLLEQRRRLVESERKREVEAQQHITAEEAMLLVSAVLESVRQHVPDQAARTAIQADFIRLTTRQNSQRLGSGDE